MPSTENQQDQRQEDDAPPAEKDRLYKIISTYSSPVKFQEGIFCEAGSGRIIFDAVVHRIPIFGSDVYRLVYALPTNRLCDLDPLNHGGVHKQYRPPKITLLSYPPKGFEDGYRRVVMIKELFDPWISPVLHDCFPMLSLTIPL